MLLLKNLLQDQKDLLDQRTGIENQDQGTLEEVDIDPEMRVEIEDRNSVVLQGIIVSQKIEKTGSKGFKPEKYSEKPKRKNKASDVKKE